MSALLKMLQDAVIPNADLIEMGGEYFIVHCHYGTLTLDEPFTIIGRYDPDSDHFLVNQKGERCTKILKFPGGKIDHFSRTLRCDQGVYETILKIIKHFEVIAFVAYVDIIKM